MAHSVCELRWICSCERGGLGFAFHLARSHSLGMTEHETMIADLDDLSGFACRCPQTDGGGDCAQCQSALRLKEQLTEMAKALQTIAHGWFKVPEEKMANKPIFQEWAFGECQRIARAAVPEGAPHEK